MSLMAAQNFIVRTVLLPSGDTMPVTTGSPKRKKYKECIKRKAVFPLRTRTDIFVNRAFYMLPLLQ